MTAEEWLRVKELFDAAVDRGPEDRAAFLAGACGGDAPLQAEVERLLKAHDEASGFIERSPVAGTAASASAAGPPLTGVVIGRYEVGHLIGSGGMGQVYAAKDRELGRPVAIKFGIGTDGVTLVSSKNSVLSCGLADRVPGLYPLPSPRDEVAVELGMVETL